MSTSYETLVEALAIPHRQRGAYQKLVAAGPDALAAVRAGLHHANADVRHYCCQYLDRFVDSGSLTELVAMLDDPSPAVRLHTLHALACDRCKEGTCRPEVAAVLPRALALLRSDSNTHVRNMAVEVVGAYVHSEPTALAALIEAIASDPHPSVRKKAAWYAPGGPIYKRTAPKPVRAKRTAAA